MQVKLNNILVQDGFLELTKKLENKTILEESFEIAGKTKLTLLASGVLMVEPLANKSELDLIISSGVHGNETAPIEIVDRLVTKILRAELAVSCRVLFIIGNPVAMNMSQRFDIENMNRLFNGKHQGRDHHEAKRAALLETIVENFYQDSAVERRHYDLHTAIRASKHNQFAVYPYPDGRPWNQQQLAFFKASGINTILLGHQPSGTFSYATSHRYGAHAFTVELGKVRPFGENNPADFAAIEQNLSALIAGQTIATESFDNKDFNLFKVKCELIKHSESFQLNIADDIENFTEFSAGFKLTEDGEHSYTVATDGEAIVFPNAKIPVGQRAGLIVERTRI
ncbi:MAG: succinylglutamate desuccinylase [Gammaproteobacteria bacterium]|nr:succinylglutamate desuccinylase [Gammaproteobacteria bacterium]